jgi:hypothetical protein
MRFAGEQAKGPRYVRVEGRTETGEVVDEGKNIGDLYCVGVHFPRSGEVVYYVKERVVTVEGDT